MTEPTVEVEEPDADPGMKIVREILEWAVVIVGALLVAFVVRAYLFTAFYIPSESMETTLLVSDRVAVSRLNYRLGEIDRGDIIVFDRGLDEAQIGPNNPAHLIKRVVALGGEVVQGREGRVWIGPDEGSMQPLVEDYLDPGVETGDFGPVTVPEGEVWLMGDNRSRSSDSRSFGPVAEDRIVGQAFFRFWPLDRLGGL